MRSFARFDTHFPVTIITHSSDFPEEETMTSIGYGGMRVDSDIPLNQGETVNLFIPDIDEHISLIGEVKWSQYTGSHYDIGIEFIHRDEDLSRELVSQIYYIDQYYRQERKKGRSLDLEQARDEWRNSLS